MTPRERMLCVYRNQMPDQIPVGIYARYLPRGSWERECRQMGLGIIDFAPPVSLLAPPWHALSGYISEVRDAAFSIDYEWQDGKLTTHHIYETPLGKLTRQTRVDSETGSEWILRHYINDSDDYERMQFLIEQTVFVRRFGDFSQREKELGEDGVLLGRIDRSGYQKLMVELANPQQIMVDLNIEPEPVERLIAKINERIREQFAMALESPAEIIWQPENITADMTPPHHFERYCLPLYKEFASRCRDKGKVFAVHMDGKLGALRDRIAEAEIDVIESFSLPEMSNDLDLTEALRTWPRSTICPNFPAALCTQSEARIRARMHELREFMGEETPFMIQISEDLPKAHYEAVLRILSQFFGAPLALPVESL